MEELPRRRVNFVTALKVMVVLFKDYHGLYFSGMCAVFKVIKIMVIEEQLNA